MRNPNGYGGISFLGANRRNPFRVRITTGWEYDENTGRQKQQYATLGYYPTRKAAMIALAEYNKNPYDIDAQSVTFEEIYKKWSVEAYAKLQQSSKRTYGSAYKQLESIHKAKMSDLKKRELQAALDKLSDKSESFQSKAKGIIKGVFKYCLENDLLEKDYSQFISINSSDTNTGNIHNAYTEDEIKLLWDNIKTPIQLKYSLHDIRDIYTADLILIPIYTGMRPGELLQIKKENVHLDERYMIGGFKTTAGTDRIIPIHEDIYPLIKARYEAAGVWLIPYKSDNPPSMTTFRKYMFDPLAEKIKLEHLPHDGRHTFATFADRSNIKDHIVKLIMGHNIDDITKNVYTHITPAELVDAVNQITFVKK